MVKRNTHTILDKFAVQNCALLEKGISCPRSFEDAFHAQNLKGLIYNAPENAWNGERMKFRAAEQIATFLGVKCYTELKELPETLWHELMKKIQEEKSFISIIKESNRLGAIDFGLNDTSNLDEILLNDGWHINIAGSVGDEVLILLRNEFGFSMIAPISTEDHEGYSNKFTSGTLRYPSDIALKFNSQSDIGQQEIIVVKSSKIDIYPYNLKTGDGKVSFGLLNRFAYRLLNSQQEFAVDSYKFSVVGG